MFRLIYFTETFFKMTSVDSKDGLEVINRLIIVIPILTIILGCPGAIFAVHYNLPVFRFLNFLPPGLNVLVIVYISHSLCLDWTFVITLVLTILIHVNSNSKWILRSRRAW